ncbi:tRNA1(Val) (adenine(37)-N6)-methyltransferase [Serpentinicella sp. ANB-PHB4]|uniref:tRNA1(Val) (adenine(37)-N6)-methyltransferase n=1 Tax=Serpentinicella sp. ANB-PHB4 TaxID=3074076 RepID=UPI00285A250F|nr:tRNA1(Val) (adenine(37)-N6)-methyltransferase [Serpentinicella sp. ANB-PHB4]MDR5659217.1 tRNA1(Val) (adenine(37)-N6)-methyltransferase [Serpentinicella sp. ANB-PHB4]
MDFSLLNEGERVDDLQVNNLKIIQNPKGFCFGIDAVLLANFTTLKKDAKVVDLGTGTGIIPILLAGKSSTSHITAVEIQEEVAEMAQRSVKLNNLEDRIKILNKDLKDLSLKTNTYDVVTSNPPYMHPHGLININNKKAISRHEIKCTLEDVIKVASKLLKHHGKFFMIHRPERLVDIVSLCRKYKLEPKRMQFIHPTYKKKANLILFECRKAAMPELKLMEPFYVYNQEGNYTNETYDVYNKKSVEEGGK